MNSWRARPNLVHTMTQEKGAVTSQETEPDLPVSVWESPAETRVGSQGHWIQQSRPQSFWRRLPLPHESLTSGKTTGKEHNSTHQYKIRLEIYWAGTAHQSKTQLTPQPVSPIRKLLLSSSIRRQTEWKPQSQKTNQTDHMDNSLV